MSPDHNLQHSHHYTVDHRQKSKKNDYVEDDNEPRIPIMLNQNSSKDFMAKYRNHEAGVPLSSIGTMKRHLRKL